MSLPVNYIFSIAVAVAFSVLSIGCSHRKRVVAQVDKAESLIGSAPDSALLLLESIDAGSLPHGEPRARYALLKSMALDKNYIDKTSFDVLQPAIDYYIDNGTPDQKLLTYYYQGRIHQNAGNDEAAMLSFINAREQEGVATDTLALARLLVAQGTLFYELYKIDDFIANNRKAAELYNNKGNVAYELSCRLNLLNGYIVLNNRELADSSMSICRDIFKRYPEMSDMKLSTDLSYALAFGTNDDIFNAIKGLEHAEVIADDTRIDLANAYSALGYHDIAKTLLDSVNIEQQGEVALKYWSNLTDIYERKGNYKDALQSYKKYLNLLEKFHMELFSKDLFFAEKRHDMQLAMLSREREKNNLLWASALLLCLFLGISGVIYYNFRLERNKKVLSEKEQARLASEGERLRVETEKLNLEKHNIELKLNSEALEAENMRLRIEQLENELANLKEISDNQNNLSEPIENAIKERIEMLNRMFASVIADNESYSKIYAKWVDELIKDKDRFIDSTRLAFKASHPKFMDYLESHGLSESEINYLCLYAIGLRGKDIGEYIKYRRHYNLSSEIRKKLGLDEHSTNIGIYIRKLMNNL